MIDSPVLLTRAQGGSLVPGEQGDPGPVVLRVRLPGDSPQRWSLRPHSPPRPWNAGLNSLPWRAILARCAGTTCLLDLDGCASRPIADLAISGLNATAGLSVCRVNLRCTFAAVECFPQRQQARAHSAALAHLGRRCGLMQSGSGSQRPSRDRRATTDNPRRYPPSQLKLKA
jgi:hypothetical protein